MWHEIEPVIEGLLVMAGKFFAARFHFHEHAARPDEIGKLGAVAGKTDAIFKSGTFGKRVGIVAEGFEQMKEKRLRLAFFVAFEIGRRSRRNRGKRVPARSSRKGLCAEELLASMPVIVTGNNGVLLFDEIRRLFNQLITFDEKQNPISPKKRPNRRAGFN